MDALLNDLATSIRLYAPRVLSAVLLIVLAWIIGSILRAVVTRVLTAAKFDERYGRHVSTSGQPPNLSKTVGDVVFWLVILFFLPAILGALELPGILAPVTGMVSAALTFLPNLFAAVVIIIIGGFVARVAQRVVTGILETVGVDRLGERIGVSQALGSQRLSNLIGLIVYFLILIPVLIAALNALQLEAITRPASAMLNNILLAIPAIFGAFLMLAIAYVVGRVVSGLISNILAAAGFDNILAHLGLGRMQQAAQQTAAQAQSQAVATTTAMTGQPTAAPATPQTPSQMVGNLILIAILAFTAIEALRLLGFIALAELLAGFLVLAGQVALGLVIFGVALWLSNLVENLIRTESTSPNANLLATAARVSILVLGGAMALRQMGLANEIVTTAFTLLIGAIAVAVAIAFGLGGRDTAAQLLEQWRGRVQSGASSTPPPTSPARPVGRTGE